LATRAESVPGGLGASLLLTVAAGDTDLAARGNSQLVGAASAANPRADGSRLKPLPREGRSWCWRHAVDPFLQTGVWDHQIGDGVPPVSAARARSGRRRVVAGHDGMEHPAHGGIERTGSANGAACRPWPNGGESFRECCDDEPSVQSARCAVVIRAKSDWLPGPSPAGALTPETTS